jgi:hypothetical protein
LKKLTATPLAGLAQKNLNGIMIAHIFADGRVRPKVSLRRGSEDRRTGRRIGRKQGFVVYLGSRERRRDLKRQTVAGCWAASLVARKSQADAGSKIQA